MTKKDILKISPSNFPRNIEINAIAKEVKAQISFGKGIKECTAPRRALAAGISKRGK